jgi:hypothetical protein
LADHDKDNHKHVRVAFPLLRSEACALTRSCAVVCGRVCRVCRVRS